MLFPELILPSLNLVSVRGCGLMLYSAVEDENDKDSLEVRLAFSKFLHEYINRNALKHSLLSKMTLILVSHTHCHKPHPHTPPT